MRRRTESSSGSALIIVLWVVGLLSVLIASFAFDAHVEARIISYYRRRTKAEYLSRSGLEIARMLMAKSRKVSEDDEDPEDLWLENAKRLKKGKVSGLKKELSEGIIMLDIIPEPARRNINSLGGTPDLIVENLERILEVGGIPEDLWPELIESFLDWTDKDGVQRFDGAETEDYYETLEPPYQAKNGPLDTVGELLLIKGWSRTILEGGELKMDGIEGIMISGIGDLLTTYGSGKVNVNAASPRVLKTLPGVDDLVAGAIIEEREGFIEEDGEKEETPFKNAQELINRLPDMNPALRDYVETDSSVYRITSIGEVSEVRREVWCIAEFDAGKNELRIKRWREED
jgi:general secretion pathway protein K